MKPIYQATGEQPGYERLLEFEEKWGKKYPLSCKSLFDNWVNLSAFFEYDYVIRKIIYTTNPIEGVHRQIRKITKTKGAFPSEQALMKLMNLVIKNINKKWTMPIHNWGLAFSQLFIKFGDRILQEHNSF
ncbi:transposase-like protein [Pedobacter sp. UYP1]